MSDTELVLIDEGTREEVVSERYARNLHRFMGDIISTPALSYNQLPHFKEEVDEEEIVAWCERELPETSRFDVLIEHMWRWVPQGSSIEERIETRVREVVETDIRHLSTYEAVLGYEQEHEEHLDTVSGITGMIWSRKHDLLLGEFEAIDDPAKFFLQVKKRREELDADQALMLAVDVFQAGCLKPHVESSDNMKMLDTHSRELAIGDGQAMALLRRRGRELVAALSLENPPRWFRSQIEKGESSPAFIRDVLEQRIVQLSGRA